MSLTKASYSLIKGAPINVLDYGADPTGVSDSAPAIRLALAAGKAVYFPAGNYLVNSSISITPALAGRVLFADGAQDSPVANIWCKNITGYLFTFDTAGTNISEFTLKGLSFDGSNGETTSQAGDWTKGSTTWQGVFKNTTGATPGTGFALEVFVRDCTVSWSKVASAAAFDVRGLFYVTIENTRIQGFVNGYGVFLGGGVTSTTITLRKNYFLFCQECVTVITGATDVQLYDCVFDSVIVATSIFFSKTLFSGCYFENIGYDITGASRNYGISLKSLGVNFGVGILDTPVNSAMNIGYAPVQFTSCFFNFYGTSIAWLYAMGRGSSSGQGGDVRFYSCYAGGQTFIDSVNYSTANTNLVYLAWYNTATTAYIAPNYISGIPLVNARLLNDGQINISFPDSGGNPIYYQQVQITNKRWIITNPTSGGTAWTGAPTNNPTGGYWTLGDTIYNLTPTAGAYMGLVCTTTASVSTTGSISSGTNTLTLSNAQTFANGGTIIVVGAGVAGANLTTTITSGGGTVNLVLATNASTTVASAVVNSTGTWKAFGAIAA
jgi:hypothetical protein